MTNINLPIQALSIRDFVFATKGLSKDDLIVLAYILGCEIEALIDFIHKIVWRLTYNRFPGGFDYSYKSQYLEVIRRYFPNEE